MSVSRVIEVSFGNETVVYVNIDTAYYYNDGVIIKPTDGDLPDTYQVHWADSPEAQTTLETIGTSEGVPVPDELWGRSKVIYGWFYLHPTEDSSVTYKEIRIYKSARAGLPDGTEPTPSEHSTIDQLISAMNTAADRAEQNADSASSDADRAETARNEAESYATAAQTSASNAEASATTATNQAQIATTSATTATTAAQTATTKATEASNSASSAAESASSASDSADSASRSKQAAKISETNAADSESNASTYANSARGYAQTAQSASASASSSATSASNSAISASNSATSASQSASVATEAKADIEAMLNDVEEYANSASQSATASANSATTAQGYANSASASAQSASGYASAALTYANTASTKASEASTSAQTATTKATEATTAAATATSAATTATTAKDDAVSAKTAAQTAQTGAETAAASVEASAAQIATNASDISQLKSELEVTSSYDITWSQGGINNSGTAVSRTNRIRTDYITIENDSIFIEIPAGFKYAIHAYNASKTRIGYIPDGSDIMTDRKATYKVSDSYDNAVYFRMWVAYVDDSDILPTEGANVTVAPYESVVDTLKSHVLKSVKILGVGNSYTRDSIRWLCKILKESGYEDVIVGHGYLGASTLAEQYASLDSSDSNHSAFEYWKYTNTQNAVKTSGKTLDEIFADEPWDIVVFQQQSDESGQYASYVSSSFDINDFITYISGKVSNADLKFGIMMPWSHADGYDGEKFAEYYNSDPSEMLDAIRTVIPQVADHMSQCDYVVNAGEAIDLGRQNSYLNALGDQMLRTDKNHLYYGIPSYMVGLVYALTLCDVNLNNVMWYPTATDEGHTGVTTSGYLAYLAKQCAFTAVNGYALADDVSDLIAEIGGKADYTDLIKAFPTDTASGSIASFSDGADDLPLKSLVVDINPIQDGTGDPSPDNVRPISGWTEVDVVRTGVNLWDEEWEVGGIRTADGTNAKVAGCIRSKDFNPIIGGASYYIKSVTGSARNVYIFFYDENKDYIGYNSKNNTVVVAPDNARFFKIQPTSTYGDVYNHDISINYPSTDHSYHPYTGRSITINLGQTVYGGHLDVLSGKLVVYPYYASYNGETLTGEWISDRDKYVSGTTPTIGAQVVNIGAQGVTVQLEPHEVASLYGVNNIWANSGDTEVEYRADTKLFIERLTAPDSADMIADANITSGQYFMVGNSLYKATANIANGSAIIVGTNCIRKSLSEALNEINA